MSDAPDSGPSLVDRVYAAQEWTEENSWVVVEDLSPDKLVGFSVEVLEAAGWDVSRPPEFVLDVPDDSELSGHAGASNVIHLHPRMLSPWTVLHELAHWIDNRDGHGARFCANLVGLVRAGIGPDDAERLLEEFRDRDVPVDVEWLEGSR